MPVLSFKEIKHCYDPLKSTMPSELLLLLAHTLRNKLLVKQKYHRNRHRIFQDMDGAHNHFQIICSRKKVL